MLTIHFGTLPSPSSEFEVDIDYHWERLCYEGKTLNGNNHRKQNNA